MSYNLVINGSNVVNALKNTYRYDFINGTFQIAEGSEIMITSLQIPYSWFNITTRNNNNDFRFHWPSPNVQSITLTNGGSGYQTAPSVQIVGANTTQATATCTIAGPVSSFTITTGGTGYQAVSGLLISGGGGSGATATIVRTGTTITGVTITNPGSGYTSPPTVTITSSVGFLNVLAGGTGYTATATVQITGGGGIGAAGSVTVVGGVITALTITNPGSCYTSAPTVVINPIGGGTGANASATLNGSGANITAVINGVVNSLTLTSDGSGYGTVLPTVQFTGANVTPATASVSIYKQNNLTLPDGFYTTTSLNSYIQQFCVSNGFYLIENSTQNNLYYINVLFNDTYYANQIILKTVPTALPAGFTDPANWAGYPAATLTPYVEILGTNHFGKFLGFTPGNYGILSTAGGLPTVAYSVNSNQTPVGSTVNSLVIRCSLVNNNVSAQTDIIDAFAISGNFGRNLNFNNNIEKWIKLNAGRYSSFTVSIVDQNMNDIEILDSNILINFIRRTRK
jgi:hypothetical protein